MAKSFYLVLTLPHAEPILCRLQGECIRLGRDGDNEIPIKMEAISSRHCEFRFDRDRGKYELIDLGSTNGTRVNDESIRNGRITLSHGDYLLLGESVVAQFIEAIEVIVKERQPLEYLDDDDLDGPGPAINPVAAAVAKQVAASQA